MRLHLSLLAAGLLAAVAAATAADSRYEIKLLERSWTPAAGVSASALTALEGRAQAQRALGGERVHALVQLYAVPDEVQKNDLWRRGLDLGAYVPGNAWIAALPAAQVRSAAGQPEVRALIPWDASRKLHPNLRRGDIAPWAIDPERPEWVMTMVLLHHDVALERGYAVADAVGGVAMTPIEGVHGLTIWVPKADVAKLAEIEDVLWVEEGPMPLAETNDGSRAQMSVDAVNAAPYNLSGTGVRVFVFDGGTVRSTHETFNPGTGSRVTLLDATAISSHSTHVAGTVGGDGAPTSAAGRGRGVATGASILSAGYQQTGGTMLFWDNAGDIQADYTLARNTHNADLGTNSIGSNTANNGYPCEREGDYGVTSNLLDGIARGDNASVGSPMIFTWANGNERTGGSPRGRCGGNYLTTAPPSCAKNPIHVGALNSDGGSMSTFSSWGPCDDGRLKPVISAPGCESGRVTGETGTYSSTSTSDITYGTLCGTSMATPAVAGTVALFIQDWRALGHGGATARPLPALVKAMLIHSARDLGQDGPDFIYGYGAVDAKGLIDTLRAGTGTLGAAGATVWGTDSISNGLTDSFTINVPAGSAELKATLVWDDAAAAAFSASAPVNNLNLELVAPGGGTSLPFVLSAASPHLPATTGVNNLDNQEQVLVANPAAGTWTVRVLGTSVPTGPQSYALAYSATPATFNEANCTTTSSTFEAGTDGWTLTGAARVAAPAAGHGSFSLQLGGAISTTHEATRDFAIPAGAPFAELSFWAYMTTAEGTSGFGFDNLFAEIRSTAGTVLSVVDLRNDGWRQATWMQQQNVDLTPWAGQTIRVAFRHVNDTTLPTTFFIDDIAVKTCTGGGGGPVCGDGIITAPEVCDGANLGGQTCVSQGFPGGGTLACAASCLAFNTAGCSAGSTTVTFTSIGAEDGRVVEGGELTNVGGTATSNSSNTSAIRLGDNNADNQFKGFLSFDTSTLPDTATITAVTVRMVRGTSSGTNPFTTHGSANVDVINGAFGGANALAAADFQAAATATAVCSLTNAAANGQISSCSFNAAGLAAINKLGRTQVRVAFTLDDNDDLGNDYIGYFSAENATAANRPTLEVTYTP